MTAKGGFGQQEDVPVSQWSKSEIRGAHRRKVLFQIF